MEKLKDLNQEVQRMRNGVGYLEYNTLGLLEIKGKDAASFLHNILTCDVKKQKEGEGCPGVQAAPKGKALTLLSLYRSAQDTYLLLNPQHDIKRLLASIEKHHFSEDFSSTVLSSDLCVFALLGPQAKFLLTELLGDKAEQALLNLQEYQTASFALENYQIRVFREPLSGEQDYVLALPSAHKANFEKRLHSLGARHGLVHLSDKAFEVLRVEAGRLLFGQDLTKENLASELGIENPVFSYNKGCYVGQEVIARIKTKGSVPFRIMGLCFAPGTNPETIENDIFDSDDKKIGSITSLVHSPTLGTPIAIARITHKAQVPGLDVRVGKESAKLLELPFFERAQSDKKEERLLYDQAMKLFLQDREEEAIELLKQELQQNQQSLDAWEALGVIYDRQGKHQKAIEAMEELKKRSPKHLMAHVNLSLYYMKIGDKERAEDYQAQATRLSLEQRIQSQEGGKAQVDDEAERIKKLEDRIQRFKAIIELDPDDVLGHFGVGKASLDLKRYREAVTHFENVLKIEKHYSVAWANLGRAYAALGEEEEARKTFEKGIQIAEEKGDLMPARDMKVRLEKLGNKVP